MEHAASMMATIGLRHVLEDGAAVLHGGGPNGARREFVLKDLAKMLSSAKRGEAVTEERQALIQAGDPSALKVYSLIYSYLISEYKSEFQSRLHRTYEAIYAISNGDSVADTEIEAARSFVTRLLDRLNSDEAYSKQREPEAFSYQLR